MQDQARWRLLPRRRGVLLYVVLAGAAGSLSCSKTGDADQPKLSPDDCGSTTANDKYYDFRIDQCVKPSSKQELVLLYTYAHTYRSSRVDDSPTAFRVKLPTPGVSPTSFSPAWAESNAVATTVELYFPEVSHGFHATVDLPSSSPPQSYAQLTAAIRKQLLADLSTSESPATSSLSAQLSQSLDSGTYVFVALWVSSTPTRLLNWWRTHYTTIDVAFPLNPALPWPHETGGFLK